MSEIFKCPYCSEKFRTRRGLSIHIGMMHREHSPRAPGIHVTPYDRETIEWLTRLSDKNLLSAYLSSNSRTNSGLLQSLKRNEIFRNIKAKDPNLTTYGEELLSELREEGRVKR